VLVSARRPEILAPAGDLQSLQAALAAGADAIYFGLDQGFNARARAANFDVDGLADTVALIHRGGARAYVTMNTLVFEPELPIVEALLRRVAAAAVDAIIVQDPAVALLAAAVCPALEVHASTQMTLSSPLAARIGERLGVTRVVVPRELSVDEIRAYREATPLELEVFVHGALCVSWSGQCLTSESWGGRSANRGQCAQSCRLPYDLVVDDEIRDLGDVRYLLSPRDLAGVEAIPALAEIGVASLKIEGRQKGPQYVATAVGGYRRWRDSIAAGTPDRATLADDLVAMGLSYTRGQSPGFLGGIDHQHLVEGRFPKHRGFLLGRVAEVRGDAVLIDGTSPTPLRAGMGVVFDQGHPEGDEPGGPLFGADEIAGGWRLRFGRPGPDLTRVAPGDRVWLSGDPQLARLTDRLVTDGATPPGRLPARLSVHGTAGHPMSLGAMHRGTDEHEVRGETTAVLAPARGRGLDEALLREKLGALGGTPFHLAELDASGLAPGLHLPVSELKELRRKVIAELERAVIARPRVIATEPVLERVRAAHAVADGDDGAAVVIPLVRNDEQLDAVLDLGCGEVELDWMEMVGLGKAVERARRRGARVTVATMRVQKPGEEKIDAHLARLEPDAVLVRSWGSLAWFTALEAPPVLHGDFSLNVTNAITAGFVLGAGLATITASHDLDGAQVRALLAAAPRHRVAVTVHHHIPTFHTEHCVYAHLLSEGRDFRSCGRPCEQHQVSLRDRTGLVHPVWVDVGCRNTVFNAQAQSAAGLVPELLAAGVRRLRVELVRESAEETARVVAAYRGLAAGELAPAEVVRRARAHEQFGVRSDHFVKLGLGRRQAPP
jgi:U32 family peptidase